MPESKHYTPERLFCPVCGSELKNFQRAASVQNLLMADHTDCPNGCRMRLQLVLED